MLNRMLTQKEQFAILFLGAAAVFGGLALWFSKEEPKEKAPVVEFASVGETASDAAPAPNRGEVAAVQETELKASHEFIDASPAPEIAVAIMGAVENEGLYRVSPDMRVGELIDKAGGTTEDADLGDINIGAKLIDGTTLTVPAFPTRQTDGNVLTNRTTVPYAPNPPQYTRSYAATTPVSAESRPAAPAAASKSAGSALVNINTATQAELETLPGIGPAFAQRIIDFREHAPFASVEQLDDVPGIGPKRLAELRPLVTVK